MHLQKTHFLSKLPKNSSGDRSANTEEGDRFPWGQVQMTWGQGQMQDLGYSLPGRKISLQLHDFGAGQNRGQPCGPPFAVGPGGPGGPAIACSRRDTYGGLARDSVGHLRCSATEKPVKFRRKMCNFFQNFVRRLWFNEVSVCGMA